jgi:PAS domain S-box-containing protein
MAERKSSLFSLGLHATNTHGPSGKLGKSLRCALKSEFRVDQVRDSSRLKIIESRDLATPSALRSPPQRRNRSGAVDDATNSVQQATGERELRQMLERQKRTFDLAMMASQMGTWRYTLADNICIYDENAQRLYGLTEAHFLHSEEGVKSKFHPDDLERMWSRVSKALDPGSDGRYDAEYRVKQLDGSWRWVSAWGLVEFEGDGADRKPVAIAGASRDITERKQAEELQRLLLNELNHRIKNTLTTIQAITALTLRAARDLPSASVALERRIHSMAQANDLLTSRTWTGANLTDVVMRPGRIYSDPSEDVRSRHRRLAKARACTVASAA